MIGPTVKISASNPMNMVTFKTQVTNFSLLPSTVLSVEKQFSENFMLSGDEFSINQ